MKHLCTLSDLERCRHEKQYRDYWGRPRALKARERLEIKHALETGYVQI